MCAPRCSFGAALSDGCHSGGRCESLCGNADSPGGRSYGALWVAADGDAVGRALAPPMSGEKMYICLVTPGGCHLRPLQRVTCLCR